MDCLGKVRYSPIINNKTGVLKTCTVAEYENICKTTENGYEYLPDDVPLKLYFDIDWKHPVSSDIEYNVAMTPYLIDFAKNIISEAVSPIIPQFSVSTSNSASFLKENELYWAISIHIAVINVVALKSEQKKMNEIFNRKLNERGEYKDYMEGAKEMFDHSVYDKNRKMRSVFCTKIGENRPLILVEGTFADSVISVHHNAFVMPLLPDRPQSPTSVANHPAINDKYLDLLHNVIVNEGTTGTWTLPYPDWFKICTALKSNGYSIEEWFRFSKLTDNNANQKMWDDAKAPMHIRVLQNIAKTNNPIAYQEWLKKWDIYYISVDDLSDPYKTAIIIAPTLNGNLKLCKEMWYMLDKQNLWKQQKEPSHHIITVLRTHIDESNRKLVYQISITEGAEKDKMIEMSKSYLKAYKTICACGFLNVLTKFLRTELLDDTFADKLDNNPHKLAFQNGIMDLKTMKLKEGISPDDYITDTIPHNYAKGSEIKKQYLKAQFLKIMNNNPEHLDYLLSLIGYSFIADPSKEKSLYFCVDKTDKSAGDNAKTFLFNILTTLMPNYVYKSKGSFLEAGNAKIHKQLALMKGSRLVWIDELSRNKLNAELMKEMADGLTTENEVMFKTSEQVNILFKLWVLTNNMPTIDAKDTAVFNRYKQISYNSHFDRTGTRTVEDPAKLLFIADTSLGDTIINDYSKEMFDIVIEYANKYYTSKPKIPAQFLKDSKETQNSNDPFGLWFADNCEASTDNMPLKKLVNSCNMSEKIVKEGMVRLGFKYDKDLSKMGKDPSTNDKAYKGGFVGCKFVEVEE